MNTAASTEENAFMELAPALAEAAKKVAAQAESSGASLPAEIPGFNGWYVSDRNDKTIDYISPIMSDKKIVYRVGTKKPE